MKFIRLLAFLLLCQRVQSAQPPDNIVINGSFEEGFVGWTGLAGVGFGFDGMADGRNRGTIGRNAAFQDLQTIPGQLYRVRFAIAGNSIIPGTLAVQTGWGDSTLALALWTSPYTPESGKNYNWAYSEFETFAASSVTRLSFAITDTMNTYGGSLAFLDDVSVAPIPEAAPFSLMCLGFVVLFVLRNRSDKSQRHH